ncbi:MAG: hypothetical protein MUF33_06870 [Candidatus Nanopelagicales bacterium]|nr:hypothetical protein [Candidatus Nanopelagicales bacterium]
MTNLLVGLAILVGLFGTVVPILPGAFPQAAPPRGPWPSVRWPSSPSVNF